MSSWCLQFSQITLENSNVCPSLLGQKFFVRFLGELKKTKSPFEINWPLPLKIKGLHAECWYFQYKIHLNVCIKPFEVDIVKVSPTMKLERHKNSKGGPYTYTLCCICLGRCCFGLETRVIIKNLKNPCYCINVD